MALVLPSLLFFFFLFMSWNFSCCNLRVKINKNVFKIEQVFDFIYKMRAFWFEINRTKIYKIGNNKDIHKRVGIAGTKHKSICLMLWSRW